MRSLPAFALLTSLVLAACSSESEPPSSSGATDGGSRSSSGSSGTNPRPTPTSASDAPTFEGSDSTLLESVPAGNSAFPQGIRCQPVSSTDADIGYDCTVLVSKTQSATEFGLTCSGTEAKMVLTTGTSTPFVTRKASQAPASFGLDIPKATFSTLLSLTINADCTKGTTRVNRPYSLTRK